MRVLSTRVASYTAQVIAGELNYLMPTPFTPGPGAIAQVEAVAEEVFSVEPGQIVFCDSHLSSNNLSGPSDEILIGWTGMNAGAPRLQAVWRDGSFAEKALWPAECLTPLPGAEALDPARLAFLPYLAISYGGLLRGDLRAGQTLLVTGATGGLGAAAVLVALALGAVRVVALGRDQDALAQLARLDPRRVTSVPLAGRPAEDGARIREAAGGADLLLDVLGRVRGPELPWPVSMPRGRVAPPSWSAACRRSCRCPPAR